MRSSDRFVSIVLVLALASAAEAQGVSPAPSIRGSSRQAWTLDEVVTAALAEHPLVEAARARVEAARAERSSAAALANPTGTFWIENAAYPGQDAPAGLMRETSLYVSFPLEPLFQRGSRSRRADEDIRAANASLALARRVVAAETVQTFFAIVLAQAIEKRPSKTARGSNSSSPTTAHASQRA
jgi:cobalt-zinc-cadmium efflux system outer membrane protein